MAKASTFKNMVVTLFITTLVSSALLGGVYELTKNAIKDVKVQKINKGIATVLPEFNNNPSKTAQSFFIDGDSVYIYTATKDSILAGVAVQTFTDKGYGGKIVLMVGFLPDGTITKTDVISHSETPGLGDKISPQKHPFSLQFNGKNPELVVSKDGKSQGFSVSKDGGDIDAISGSTVSSRAFCDAVNRAYKVYREKVLKTEGQWDGASGATKTTNSEQ